MKIKMSFHVTTYELEPQTLAKMLRRLFPSALALPLAKQTGLPSHVELLVFDETESAASIEQLEQLVCCE